MINSEDFQLSLEAQLKLRVLTDEIDRCTDIEQLRTNLKEVTTLLVKYQKIINGMLKRQLENDVTGILLFVEDDNIEKDT